MKNPNIKVSSVLTEYLSPSKVYLPVSYEDQLLIREKKVNRGSSLFQKDNKTIYSPISGNVKRIVKRVDYNGKEQTYLEIINDYKEEDFYEGSERTTTIMVHDVKKLLENNSRIQSFHLEKKKKIFLNLIEDEPYVANHYFLSREHKDEILLFLDTLASIYHISTLQILVKESDSEIIELYEQVLETYPTISLQILPDIYFLGNETFLRSYLKMDSSDFLISLEEVLEYYYEIVKMRKKDFIYLTLTGDAVKNPQVVKVKRGTLGEEILKLLEFSEPYDFIVNHLLYGEKKNIESVVLTEEIQVLYFMKKTNRVEQSCVHCGKCDFVCPMKCKPYRSVITKGTYKNMNCLSCGLCTFVCPSNIELKKYLRK